MDVILSTREMPSEKNIKDYGNDPFESNKWCDFLAKANLSIPKESDDESCFSEVPSTVCEWGKCPIYEVLKKRDMVNSKKVTMKEIWHITEYWHGKSERRHICPRKERRCSKMHRLENGGYHPTDIRHSVIFRHPNFRREEKFRNIPTMNTIEVAMIILTSQFYEPTMREFNSRLFHLIKEVIGNGYKEDLLCARKNQSIKS